MRSSRSYTVPVGVVLTLIANIPLDPFQIARAEAHHAIAGSFLSLSSQTFFFAFSNRSV